MAPQKTLSARAWGELTLLALIWGGSFLAIRIALDEIPALSSVVHRVLWAATALWLIVALKRLPLPRGWRIWLVFLGMGALNNAIPFSLMAWGQLHIEVGLTAILNASTAIWGVLLGALFFVDERLTPSRLIGVVVGFLGVATAIGLANLLSFDLQSVAQLAVVLGTLSYAVAGVYARRFMGDVSPIVAAAGMLTGATLIMVPIAWVVDGPLTFDFGGTTVAAIGYYALISTAFAYLIYYRVLAMAGSGNLMLVTLLLAPVSIFLGAMVRGEALSSNAYLGFALLGLGLLILDGRIYNRLRNFKGGAASPR